MMNKQKMRLVNLLKHLVIIKIKTMSYKKTLIYSIILLLTIFVNSISAQTTGIYSQKKQKLPKTRILFVFDASLSMTGKWQSDKKITIARNLLSDLLDSLKYEENIDVALRCYGHQKNYPPQDCDDTRLEVPFGSPNAFEKIKHKLRTINPRGTTPIALSLEAAANDFTPCDNCRNIIILITDGLEECDGDPCAVSLALQKQGIVLKPFVIGIGKDFSQAFDCVGTYYDASSEKQFRKALDVVISQALNSTTCQVNLLDIYNNPTETNVNMTFYDKFSGKIIYNFMHTLNSRGVPDTLILDAMLNYRLHIHTIPPVFIDSLGLTPGKHTIVGVDAPQGMLQLKIGTNPKLAQQYNCIVRKHKKMQTLNLQNFTETEKYLVGNYDLEILTLPRIYVDNVKISQSKTTTVEIPTPGSCTFEFPSVGFASLYVDKGDEMKWVYNLKMTSLRETLIIQPGHYVIVYRSKFHNRSFYTIEKAFEVESNKSSRINLSQF
jgi:Ca-activated chloride channel family protein